MALFSFACAHRRDPRITCAASAIRRRMRAKATAESEVCRHAERLLNMVHAYCEIRDSWTGWLRGDAMSRTLYERIVPEMRALRDAERRIMDTPSVTLLAVLDYAARAREAVPAYTPRETIDYPQPPDRRMRCVPRASA